MSESTVTVVTNPDIYNGSNYTITSIGLNQTENSVLINSLELIPYNITLNLQDINSTVNFVWLTTAIKSSNIVIINFVNYDKCDKILQGWILSQPTCYFITDKNQYDIISSRRITNFIQPIKTIFKNLED